MALADIADVAERAKKRKREREALMNSYANLSCIDLHSISTDTLEKIPIEAKESCFIAKYGVALVSRARQLLKNLPNSLTDNQLRQIVAEITAPNEKLQEVAFLLLDKFRYLLHSEDTEAPPPPIVLAPPTSSCYECGRQLVSNHRTNVRW